MDAGISSLAIAGGIWGWSVLLPKLVNKQLNSQGCKMFNCAKCGFSNPDKLSIARHQARCLAKPCRMCGGTGKRNVDFGTVSIYCMSCSGSGVFGGFAAKIAAQSVALRELGHRYHGDGNIEGEEVQAEGE